MSTPRLRLIAFLFGLAILHGMVVNLMPVMFTSMEAAFGVDKTHQALLKSYFFGGSALALVVSGYVTQYLGVRRTCIALAILAGTGAVAFGLAPSYQLVLFSAALLAIGTAPLAAIYASIISTAFHDARQRVYMVTYGILAVSATCATLGLGALLDRFGSYSDIFVGLGVFIWLWMALLLVMAWDSLDVFQADKTSRRPPDFDARSNPAKVATCLTSGIFGCGALYLMALLMIFDYLFASNLLSWTPTYFEQQYGQSKLLAGSALSASSIGVAVGRATMATLPQGRVPDRILLAGCYAGGVICFSLMLLFQPPYAVSVVLLGLCGAFIAAQAPTMASLAIAKFGSRAQVAIPIYEAVGMLAGIFGPVAVGYFADRTGKLETILLVIPAAGLALAIIAVLWEWYDRKHHVARVAGTLVPARIE